MIKTAAIEPDVLEVLAAATVDGDIVRLNGQLDRKLYERTNKALEALGGKWNRGKKGHLFTTDAALVLGLAIENGEYVDPRLNGFFPTPDDLADDVIAWAEIKPGMRVLEPSAGRGALASRALTWTGINIDVCEILPDNIEVLQAIGFQLIGRDFLSVEPTPIYDRVVMNPPFAKGADVKHVTHALRFLKPGGRLVAIMANSITFRVDQHTQRLREQFEQADEWALVQNPENSFQSLGTGVRTVMVMVQTGEAEEVAA